MPPKRPVTRSPIQRVVRTPLSGSRKRYPSGLVSFWNAKNPTVTPVGPDPVYSAASTQPDANGNLVTWPNYVPGRGVEVHPAYTQLIPYSEPSALANWSAQGGVSITASSGGLAAFCTSATVFGDNSVSRIAYVSIDNVATDQILSVYVEMDDGSLPVPSLVNNTGDFSLVMNSQISNISVTVYQVSSTVYMVSAKRASIGANVSFGIAKYTGQSTKSFKCSRINLTRVGYLMPYVKSTGTSVSVASTAATSSNNGLAIPLDAKMTAALSADGAFTAAALVEMGVSSVQVAAPANILSVNDVVSGLIFADAGGKLKCTDGTNTAEVTVTGGWTRTDELLPVVQCDGTEFRIGYAKNTLSAITWGAAVAVGADGDWNVVTHERIGLNSTIPFGVQQVQVWNVVSEAGVLKVAGYAL